MVMLILLQNLSLEADKWLLTFSTQSLNEDGSWKNLTKQNNSASDISCTAGQMPRLVGLAQASKYIEKQRTYQIGHSFLIKEMRLRGEQLVTPQHQKDTFLKLLTQQEFYKFLWLFRYGMMNTEFQCIVDTKH